MQSIDVPIIGDSNDVAQDDPQRTLNMYAEKVDGDILTLKPTPGSSAYAQFSVGGGGRGLIVADGRLFGVRGGTFQEIVSGNPVTRGVLGSTTGKVGIIACIPPYEQDGPPKYKKHILIVDETGGYIFGLSDNSFMIAPPEFKGGGSQAAFCAGRAYVLVPGTTQLQCSNQYDFTTWQTTSVFTALSLTSPVIAVASNGELLYIFSAKEFELWRDSNDVTIAVNRILTGDKIGILAKHSALFCERYIYWVAESSTGQGIIYRHSGGGSPERVSNHSTERNIATYANPSDAVAFTYQSLGHTFYIVTFFTGNATIAFDKVTGLWHDRCQRDPNSNAYICLPFMATVIYNGIILAVDWQTGAIVQIDDAVYTDLGNDIPRERVIPVTPKEGDFLSFLQSVELFGEFGNTPINQPDPFVMLRYSVDRGKTWSLEDWVPTGGTTSYEGRVKWTGLGSGYGFAIWFKIVASQYISWRGVRMRME